MNIDEYAWNKHEQKTKEQTEFTYSKPKIKILDNYELRNKIEEELEKLPQKLLIQWALKVAIPYLDYLDNHLKGDPRIDLGVLLQSFPKNPIAVKALTCCRQKFSTSISGRSYNMATVFKYRHVFKAAG